MTRRRRFPFAVALLVAFVAVGSGCITRTVRKTVYEDRAMRVVLRAQKKGTSVVERDFQHPFAIAPVRLAHVLSRIDVRTESKKGSHREPAIATNALYDLADHLAAALEEANPNQEIVVYSIRRSKRFGVFDRRHLTSFVAYARNDLLYIHLSRINWEIPKSGKVERLPAPNVGDYVMKFRVLPSEAMTMIDGQSVAIEWRAPVFKKPTRTSVNARGEVVRRTILMETPVEEEVVTDDPNFERLPENLSSATLRDLADLEDERHSGKISEMEYNTRRREIIRSDLGE